MIGLVDLVVIFIPVYVAFCESMKQRLQGVDLNLFVDGAI